MNAAHIGFVFLLAAVQDTVLYSTHCTWKHVAVQTSTIIIIIEQWPALHLKDIIYPECNTSDCNRRTNGFYLCPCWTSCEPSTLLDARTSSHSIHYSNRQYARKKWVVILQYYYARWRTAVHNRYTGRCRYTWDVTHDFSARTPTLTSKASASRVLLSLQPNMRKYAYYIVRLILSPIQIRGVYISSLNCTEHL